MRRHSRAEREESPAIANDLPSLLWPSHAPPASRSGIRLRPDVLSDLDVAPLVKALSGQESRREGFVASVLTDLCVDPAVIGRRQEIVDNLLAEGRLRRNLLDLLPRLSALVGEHQRPVYAYDWDVGQIVRRLGDLELYVQAADALSGALAAREVRAGALLELRHAVHTLVESTEFLALREELPALRSHLEPVQSVTIGINLATDLRPESATILSVDSERIEGRGGLLERLLGRRGAGRGITSLRGTAGSSLGSFFPPMQLDPYGHENALMRDLRRLLESVVAPVGQAIDRYLGINTRQFSVLESELSFLLHAVDLIERLQSAGLPICRPEISATARSSHLAESYNVSLALRMMRESESGHPVRTGDIVTNVIRFDYTRGRVWILTGPNGGGKTTYARAVGLAHLLFQAGLFVPATTASLSPIDAIYTHFPTMETTTVGEGRLDDEAERLAEIFREATPDSLILLNEVLSGTSTLEALALAHDAVRGLHLLGARAIYVTHLHELAARVDEINRTTAGDGTVGSLVAEVDEAANTGETRHRRTFRIRAKAPAGLSYASEIAEQHGISYGQLVNLLAGRGLAGSPPVRHSRQDPKDDAAVDAGGDQSWFPKG